MLNFVVRFSYRTFLSSEFPFSYRTFTFDEKCLRSTRRHGPRRSRRSRKLAGQVRLAAACASLLLRADLLLDLHVDIGELALRRRASESMGSSGTGARRHGCSRVVERKRSRHRSAGLSSTCSVRSRHRQRGNDKSTFGGEQITRSRKENQTSDQ